MRTVPRCAMKRGAVTVPTHLIFVLFFDGLFKSKIQFLLILLINAHSRSHFYTHSLSLSLICLCVGLQNESSVDAIAGFLARRSCYPVCRACNGAQRHGRAEPAELPKGVRVRNGDVRLSGGRDGPQGWSRAQHLGCLR
jgi:hypothetical protein